MQTTEVHITGCNRRSDIGVKTYLCEIGDFVYYFNNTQCSYGYVYDIVLARIGISQLFLLTKSKQLLIIFYYYSL